MHSWGTFPILLTFTPYASIQLLILPDISLISLSIGSYLELAIFRDDFSSVASVNVRFSWVFDFVFICSGYKLNSPHCVMGRQAPACFHCGLSRLSEVTIFATDACMLNPVREGEEDWSDSLPSSLENFWKFLVQKKLGALQKRSVNSAQKATSKVVRLKQQLKA